MRAEAGGATELGRQFGVLFGDPELRSGSFGVGEGVDDFSLGAGELSGTLKILEGFGNLVLLQEKLGHGGDSNVALGVD